MLHSSRAFCLSLLLALLGCGASNDAETGKSNQTPVQGGAGGSRLSAASGSGGSTNQPPLGGATSGGSSPVFGPSGSGGTNSGGLGGTGALGLAGGMGGATAGLGGIAGSSSGVGSAGTNGRGPAPTFTTIYNTIIIPNCGGSMCHLKRPTPFGYDFSSQSAASSSWRGDVTAGDADNSPMFQVLNFAIMPKDKAPLSIDQLFMVYDWINAGALDN